jgi:uncharacterized phage protein (TIGR02220 family)/predicted phage replisome organizer
LAEVKWIKLATGLPDNKKIKQIRKLPDGNTIALMWVFLMCLAGDTNDEGMVYFTPEIPFTDEMLADQFDMDINTIRLGIATFQKFGMIEVVDKIICLSSWEKWQATDGLAVIREQTRKRVAKHREKQKLALCNVTGNVTVTQCNATDIEEDKEKETETEIYKTVVSYLNQKAGTNYRPTTPKTKTAIKARLSEGFTVEDFKTVIDKKCIEWLGNDTMEKYLRPETLFGTKFEGYLNAKVSNRSGTVGANGIAISNTKSDLEGVF